MNILRKKAVNIIQIKKQLKLTALNIANSNNIIDVASRNKSSYDFD
jgi:hypothetical protein